MKTYIFKTEIGIVAEVKMGCLGDGALNSIKLALEKQYGIGADVIQVYEVSRDIKSGEKWIERSNSLSK